MQSDYPFPVKVKKPRVQVIYIDKDHLHLYVGPNPDVQREITQDHHPKYLRSPPSLKATAAPGSARSRVSGVEEEGLAVTGNVPLLIRPIELISPIGPMSLIGLKLCGLDGSQK